MKINEFTSETWLTEHELNYTYNLCESCIKSMTLLELSNTIGTNLSSKLMGINMDYGDITGSIQLKVDILSLYSSGTIDNLTLTHGTINANELVLMELLEQDDHIVVLTPTYQQLYDFPLSFGCEVTCVDATKENQWLWDIYDIKDAIKPNTKAIILNSPNNPTGVIIPVAMMMEIVEIAKENDLYIVCDEVYRGMSKDGFDYPSFSDLYDKAIVTGGISKVLRAPGLRVGWIKGPDSFIQLINFRRDYSIISIGPINDYLAHVVLTHKDEILASSHEICNNSKLAFGNWLINEPLVDAVIPCAGTTCLLEYHLDLPSDVLCDRLQKETGIMFIPGSTYGCEHTVRFGFTHDETETKEGLEKFTEWLNQYR